MSRSPAPGSPTTASGLGQGRENSKQFLRDNPVLADEIELLLRQNAGLIAEKFLEEDRSGGDSDSDDSAEM